MWSQIMHILLLGLLRNMSDLHVFFFDGQLYKSRPNVRIVADLEEISAVVTDFTPRGHIYKYGALWFTT